LSVCTNLVLLLIQINITLTPELINNITSDCFSFIVNLIIKKRRVLIKIKKGETYIWRRRFYVVKLVSYPIVSY
jgi:hypothetical protein